MALRAPVCADHCRSYTGKLAIGLRFADLSQRGALRRWQTSSENYRLSGHRVIRLIAPDHFFPVVLNWFAEPQGNPSNAMRLPSGEM